MWTPFTEQEADGCHPRCPSSLRLDRETGRWSSPSLLAKAAEWRSKPRPFSKVPHLSDHWSKRPLLFDGSGCTPSIQNHAQLSWQGSLQYGREQHGIDRVQHSLMCGQCSCGLGSRAGLPPTRGQSTSSRRCGFQFQGHAWHCLSRLGPRRVPQHRLQVGLVPADDVVPAAGKEGGLAGWSL